VYVMVMAGITITDVITGIQYGRITKILNEMNETNIEKEGSY